MCMQKLPQIKKQFSIYQKYLQETKGAIYLLVSELEDFDESD